MSTLDLDAIVRRWLGRGSADGRDDVLPLVAEVRSLRTARDALVSALDRTEENFRRSVIGVPVRDMSENLGENDAARALALDPDPGDTVPDRLVI